MKFSICDWVTKNIFFYFIFCKKVKWVVYTRINCIWFLGSIYLDPGFEPLISQRWISRFYPFSHRAGHLLPIFFIIRKNSFAILGFFQVIICKTPHSPPSKIAVFNFLVENNMQCTETKEKSIFQFFFFELGSILFTIFTCFEKNAWKKIVVLKKIVVFIVVLKKNNNEKMYFKRWSMF